MRNVNWGCLAFLAVALIIDAFAVWAASSLARWMIEYDMQDCVILGSVATFDGVAPDKAQALKVLEEASEVYNAWQVWDECRDDEAKAECRQSLMEECADVVQATVNLVKACGCDDMRLHLMDCEDRNRKRGRITGSKPYPDACGREGCKRFVFVPIPRPYGVLSKIKAKIGA